MSHYLIILSIIEACFIAGLISKVIRLEREVEAECSAELAELYEEVAQLRNELRDVNSANAELYFSLYEKEQAAQRH
ncbi:hypothetical protein [Enterobacter sp. CP102]|uniref:hypothetical protein n=1 Tax=Enterobacter sp. CP102 TaxID=2976431 RepID=UPI0021FDF1F8|nr:hypothetical protein [Enterobacter sp. CP102]UWM62294.1 hypothetical protein N1249_11850 [Enterobacter sp. CP102]